MDLKFASYFLAIVEYGNLSRASEALYITQSTLSQFLKKEEFEMGVQLFVRHHNELVLTEAGKQYAENCRKMLEMKEILKRQVETARFGGSATIGITPQWGGEMFADIYPHFNREYPNFTLDLVENNTKPLLDLVLRDKIDLAVLAMDDGNLSSFDMVPVCREELILAIPVSCVAIQGFVSPYGRGSLSTGVNPADWNSQHAGRTGKHHQSISLSAIRSESFIISRPGTSIRDSIDAAFEKAGIKPRIACEINNISASLKLVASGLGISIIPLSFKYDDPRIMYMSMDESTYWNICTFVRKNHKMTEPENFFFKLVKDYFAVSQEKWLRDW